jgi:hypothetical protein
MGRRPPGGWGRSKRPSPFRGFVTCRAGPLGRGMSIFPITRIDQVAVVVRDLDAAMRHRPLGDLYIRPTVRSRPDLPRPGSIAPAASRARAAANSDGGVDSTALRRQYLSLEEAAQRGYTVLQMGRGYGRWGDGGFAYLDTEDALGMILELIEIPRERFPPENVYPLR